MELFAEEKTYFRIGASIRGWGVYSFSCARHVILSQRIQCNKISSPDLPIDSFWQPCIGRYPSLQLDPLLCELIHHWELYNNKYKNLRLNKVKDSFT